MSVMVRKSNTWQVAKKYGIDITLLKANLDKSPTQRVRDHLSALELAKKLRIAGRKYYARIRKAS